MSARRRTAIAAVVAALLLGGTACTASAPDPFPACTAPACTPMPSPAPSPSTASTAAAACPAAASGPRHAMGATVTGTRVRLGSGTYAFSDFSVVPGIQRIGLLIPPSVSGFAGAGAGATVLEMTPDTSTAASSIPARFPASNPLSLMRAAGPTVRLSGFSLLGTDQGHPYNGLRVERAAGARVSDVCVAGVPGTDRQPPGETFGISDNLTTGSVYRRVTVDGRGRGAAGLGVSVSSGVTVLDSRFVGNRYSSGATFWEVRDATLRDVTATGNGLAGLNFERVSGTVRIDRPVLGGDAGGDLRIASDEGSARYVITDPVLSGDGLLTIAMPPTYYGHPNLQRTSDIEVMVHGRDRTADLVRVLRR